jgi:hypothetical protein
MWYAQKDLPKESLDIVESLFELNKKDLEEFNYYLRKYNIKFKNMRGARLIIHVLYQTKQSDEDLNLAFLDKGPTYDYTNLEMDNYSFYSAMYLQEFILLLNNIKTFLDDFTGKTKQEPNTLQNAIKFLRSDWLK